MGKKEGRKRLHLYRLRADQSIFTQAQGKHTLPVFEFKFKVESSIHALLCCPGHWLEKTTLITFRCPVRREIGSRYDKWFTTSPFNAFSKHSIGLPLPKTKKREKNWCRSLHSAILPIFYFPPQYLRWIRITNWSLAVFGSEGRFRKGQFINQGKSHFRVGRYSWYFISLKSLNRNSKAPLGRGLV